MTTIIKFVFDKNRLIGKLLILNNRLGLVAF